MKKIDIYNNKKYQCSTTCCATCREAKKAYIMKFRLYGQEKAIKAHFSKV